MRSEVAKRMLNKMPLDVKIFTRKYSDLVVLINQILKEKGFTQKNLADKLDKRPSEINRWLSGDHNFTLRSIAKLEAELGETLLEVPKRKSSTEKFDSYSERSYHKVIYLNKDKSIKTKINDFKFAVNE